MNVIEAIKILEEHGFDGHVECEDYAAKHLKCVISFDKDEEQWHTNIYEYYNVKFSLKEFYALPKQMTCNDWVVWLKKTDEFITEYPHDKI